MKTPPLVGVGVYPQADASRLLRMTPSRVGRWVRGYSDWLSYATERERRAQPPILRARLPRLAGTTLLSFLDLMELRVVKALVDRGLSLQHVRGAARLASGIFKSPYPFASRRFYTDGQAVFASLSREADDDRIIEISRRHLQIIFGKTFEGYLEEIDFDPQSSLARRWWPLGRKVPVVLDPRVAFGAPIVEGTATRTDVVAGLAVAAGADMAGVAFHLKKEKVEAAVRFESRLAAAA